MASSIYDSHEQRVSDSAAIHFGSIRIRIAPAQMPKEVTQFKCSKCSEKLEKEKFKTYPKFFEALRDAGLCYECFTRATRSKFIVEPLKEEKKKNKRIEAMLDGIE